MSFHGLATPVLSSSMNARRVQVQTHRIVRSIYVHTASKEEDVQSVHYALQRLGTHTRTHARAFLRMQYSE